MTKDFLMQWTFSCNEPGDRKFRLCWEQEHGMENRGWKGFSMVWCNNPLFILHTLWMRRTKSLIQNGSYHPWLGNNKKEDSKKLQSSFHLQKRHIDIAELTSCNKEVTPLGPYKVNKALPQLSFDPSYLVSTWTNKFKVGKRKLP